VVRFDFDQTTLREIMLSLSFTFRLPRKGCATMSTRTLRAGLLTVIAVLAIPLGAQAHCDAVDGPVATAAVQALETKNVNLVLPFAPARAEAELTAAFEQALLVRGQTPEAQILADRYFMETAVRLHRAGEGAPYTGLKAAGMDFGPAIPAAENALESGHIEPIMKVLSEELSRNLSDRFEQTQQSQGASKEPTEAAEVPTARKRVSAELGLIGYVESIYLAITGGESHPEAGAGQTTEEHTAVKGAVQGC
jgi:hypothetical protein